MIRNPAAWVAPAAIACSTRSWPRPIVRAAAAAAPTWPEVPVSASRHRTESGRGVPHPRLDLEPEGEAGQCVAAGNGTAIGHRKDRRPHGAAAVHSRSGRVVHVGEIKHVRRRTH